MRLRPRRRQREIKSAADAAEAAHPQAAALVRRVIELAERRAGDAGTTFDPSAPLPPGRVRALIGDLRGTLATAEGALSKYPGIESYQYKWVLDSLRHRAGTRRVPFISAMSLLGARDGEPRSYLEIADGLRRHGAAASTDLAQLWRRIVFNVLISNVDDHLRNHAFLYTGPDGWRLSPAFDLNPMPTDVRPRVLTTSIVEGDSTASVELALEVAKDFAVSAPLAKTTVEEVVRSVKTWKAEASRLGLSRANQGRMASAFEHPDLARLT